MSFVTIQFVLERMLRYANTDGAAVSKSIYAAAFGPGVSLESALIRLHDPKK
jgi:predicted naringenin-chalcone synthase